MKALPYLYSILATALLLVACGDETAGKDSGAVGNDTGVPDQTDADADGYSVADGDCDDTDPQVNPGATEIFCDGIDNDCLDGDLRDRDGDGFDGMDCAGDDCNDEDPSIYPEAIDFCGDFLDMDCDGDSECDCDHDGFDGEQCDGTDCDDSDSTMYPDADDTCYDGVDSDCNGDSDYDCDNDGFDSSDYDGDDCDDTDSSTYPGAPEICLDGVDNDCDDSTNDCDCDLDGHLAVECGGDDCDDSEPTTYPGAPEDSADGMDSDCDGDIDEDAYCNLYAPLSNGSSATRSYDSFMSGSDYTELITVTDWDPATGEATVNRNMTDATGLMGFDIDEYWTCDSTGVYMTGYDLLFSGMSTLSVSFSEPRRLLMDEASMIPGAQWDYSYIAEDSLMGLSWSVQGSYRVLGTDTYTLGKETFDTLIIANHYELVDLTYGLLDQTSNVTMYYVQRLGLVWSEDLDETGVVQETREMTEYSGFYP